MVLEFKIGKNINLKLEDGKTNIYINNKLFRHCKYLLLEIPAERIKAFDEIETIDSAIEKFGPELELRRVDIPSHVEFWGHSSNLQAWYENNYDTRLLASNLAFPLLKELAEVGDARAKQAFKEELLIRLRSNDEKITNFLIEEGYSQYLSHEEFISSILDEREAEILKELGHKIKNKINFIIKLEENGQPGIVVNNRHVVYLSLLDNNIKVIPKELGNLTELEYLDLGFNKIINIPNSLKTLTNLKVLNLDKNKIPNIPDLFGELKSLKTLTSIGNEIGTIPDSIGNLKNLKELILSRNCIIALPDSIGKLKSLESLRINSNQIKELPNSIGNLENLKELYIGYNKLTSLPISIGKLTNIRTLCLEHNSLTKIPDVFENLKKLESLYLNDNDIENIPDSFKMLSNLKHLNLKNNKIKEFELKFGDKNGLHISI